MMKNIFSCLPKKLDEEFIDEIFSSGQLTVERIVSKGHTSPENGWYDQDRNEWVLVLEGAGRLQFRDGLEVLMKAGDYIEIPAHQQHKVSWTEPNKKTVWLAIHY